MVSLLTHIQPPTPQQQQQQQGQTVWTRPSADARSTEEWTASEGGGGSSELSSDDGALETARELNDDDHTQPWRVQPNRWADAYSSHTAWDE